MNRIAAEAEREAVESDKKTVRIDYVAELERRMMQTLGRKVKISSTRNKKTVTLYFEDNDDLDTLLRALCGEEFMNEV